MSIHKATGHQVSRVGYGWQAPSGVYDVMAVGACDWGKPVARMVDYLAPERAPALLRVPGPEEIPRFQFLSPGTLRSVSPARSKILRPSAHSNHSSYSCRWDLRQLRLLRSGA